ncbi:MAG: chemotaxis protein CheW [Myxococcota bacterium]
MSQAVAIETRSGTSVAGSGVESLLQYLTFEVARETYGIPIGSVAEIIGVQRITHVPDPRSHVKGVINLRGTVIPVIDVRLRMGMAPIEIGDRTCIVVVQLDRMLVGMLVDTIAGVIDVMAGEIEAAPRRRASTIGDAIVTGFVHGDEGVRILVDPERLLTDAERACGTSARLEGARA